MEGWRKLSDVAQLKWGIIAKEPGVLNETEVKQKALIHSS